MANYLIYLDLILNLTLLVALSVVSGFVDKRWQRGTRLGVLMQGFIFGGAAVTGMLRPLNLGPGLIFDGRSVMVSLCALHFGPWAVAVAGMMAAACRIGLGGAGVLTGVLVILSSAGIGLLAHVRLKPEAPPPSAWHLYLFGIVVHLAMLALMFTLPGGAGPGVLKHIGLPVMLLYPLATILSGKILSDQVESTQVLEGLRESEERYRELFEKESDAIMVFDVQTHRFEDANPATLSLYGYTRKEFLGLTAEDISAEPDETRTMIDRILAGDAAPMLIPMRYQKKKDGTVFPVEISAGVFYIGGHRKMIGAVRDITERKRAEQALRAFSARQEAILDAVPDIIMEVDANKVYIGANQAGLEFFGEDAIGREAEFYFEGEQNTYQTVQPLFNGAENVLYVESWQRRKDGRKRLLAWWCRVLKNALGEVTGAISSARDITDRHQAEEELRLKNAELERFIYTISHDLKTPLVTIKTFLGYLEEDRLKSDAQRVEKDLFYLRAAADKMGQLLDELLKMSRIGRVVNPSVRVTFRELVKEALTAVAGRIAERGVEVRVSDEELALFGDRQRLAEIWQNLIENAVKFMGAQASPRIDIGAEPGGRQTVFFVRDNGMGIDPRYHDKIFGLFERLDPKIEGTGLGLALVRRIVELHGGTIVVESRGEGHGASFRFTLPHAVISQPEGEKS